MSDLSIKIVPARVVDAQEMELLIDAFMADRVKETHKATAAGYRREIEPFRRWWRQSSAIHHHKLTQDLFTAFIHWCEHEYINSLGNKASSYTLHKITIRVRHLLTWTHQMGYVPTNITELCPLYHYRDTVKYYPKPQELAAIIKAPTGKERIRDTAFLAFSLSTGARRNEIVNAKVENLTFATPLSNLQVGADHRLYSSKGCQR